MEIIVAEKSGYCFGIKNAMKLVQETLEKEDQKIYSLGPISHNKQEIERLEKRCHHYFGGRD